MPLPEGPGVAISVDYFGPLPVTPRGNISPYRPLCSVLYRGGGEALYRPLCLVLYRGRRFSTVPCFRFSRICTGEYHQVNTSCLISIHVVGFTSSMPALFALLQKFISSGPSVLILHANVTPSTLILPAGFRAFGLKA